MAEPWDPARYTAEIGEEIARYDKLQERVAAASAGIGARRILELGTGSGETALLLLERYPNARLVGVGSSAEMLAAAAEALPGDRVELRLGRLEDELPLGPFDLVASALAVHHLTGADKASLFRRVAAVLEPGGRFVLRIRRPGRHPVHAHAGAAGGMAGVGAMDRHGASPEGHLAAARAPARLRVRTDAIR